MPEPQIPETPIYNTDVEPGPATGEAHPTTVTEHLAALSDKLSTIRTQTDVLEDLLGTAQPPSQDVPATPSSGMQDQAKRLNDAAIPIHQALARISKVL